jgi:hypothetical protein
LGGDHRKAHHQRREKSDLHLGEESFENVGVDKLALAGAAQRLNQHRENLVREMKANKEGEDQRRQAP